MALYAEYYEAFQQADEKCTRNLMYIPPEAMVLLEGARRPVIVLAKMAQKVCQEAPEADQPRLMAALVKLADMAAQTPSQLLLKHWWAPMCHQHLPELLGDNDMPWKQDLINIWMDESIKDVLDIPDKI
jgi:hypothetical protein